MDMGGEIFVDSSGKIYVAGGSDFSWTIWKYNNDGSPDVSFSGDGIVSYANGGNIRGISISVNSAGEIFTAGNDFNNSENHNIAILKYNNDGFLDTTFGDNGIVLYDSGSHDNVYSMFIDSSGKIYLTGKSYNTNNDMIILKYNNDGSPDISFNDDGVVIHDNAAGGDGDDIGQSIIVDSNGKIYVSGISENNYSYDMVIWKYNSDGSLDTSFNGDGILLYEDTSNNYSGYETLTIAMDSSDALYTTGSFDNGLSKNMGIWSYIDSPPLLILIDLYLMGM